MTIAIKGPRKGRNHVKSGRASLIADQTGEMSPLPRSHSVWVYVFVNLSVNV